MTNFSTNSTINNNCGAHQANNKTNPNPKRYPTKKTLKNAKKHNLSSKKMPKYRKKRLRNNLQSQKTRNLNKLFKSLLQIHKKKITKVQDL